MSWNMHEIGLQNSCKINCTVQPPSGKRFNGTMRVKWSCQRCFRKIADDMKCGGVMEFARMEPMLNIV